MDACLDMRQAATERAFVVFGVAAVLMLTAAALAGFVPARKASRVDPMVALHHERRFAVIHPFDIEIALRTRRQSRCKCDAACVCYAAAFFACFLTFAHRFFAAFTEKGRVL